MSDAPVRGLTAETFRVLSSAIPQDVPVELRTYLQENTFIFSGFKTYHELKEASVLLQDDKGGFKSFEAFKRDITGIDNTYNRNYLNAEYKFAVQSSQMAVKWHEFEKDGDRYLLQYRTASDDKVRPEHAVLNGTTLPIDDPFWNSYLPPLDWGCRCTTMQVSRNKYPMSNSQEACAAGERATALPKQKIFRFNPGKDKIVFPPKHPYFKLAKEEKKAVSETIHKIAKEEIKNDKLKEIVDDIKAHKITYLAPQELDVNTSEEQIINRLAGSDKTRGSCSSLALAYAGNKAGIDVLDFRDGESRRYFAQDGHISKIVSSAGGTVVAAFNDFAGASQLLATIEGGKEYYFACGKHAAIVRKVNDTIEYLELQSDSRKGWHKLTKVDLQHRFGAQRSHTFYGSKYKQNSELVEIGLLRECGYFKEMLGYINTQADKQNKGVGGSIK